MTLRLYVRAAAQVVRTFFSAHWHWRHMYANTLVELNTTDIFPGANGRLIACHHSISNNPLGEELSWPAPCH